MRILRILFFFCITLYLFSCSKKSSGCGFQNNNTVAPNSEQLTLKEYLDSNGIIATKDSSGFYYQIIDSGSGKTPEVCSQVTVSYTGSLTNGTVFEQENSYIGILGAFIPGWEQGLQLIKSGGDIKLYIPPSLGYGASGANSVPPNSILIFDVNMLDVQ